MHGNCKVSDVLPDLSPKTLRTVASIAFTRTLIKVTAGSSTNVYFTIAAPVLSKVEIAQQFRQVGGSAACCLIMWLG